MTLAHTSSPPGSWLASIRHALSQPAILIVLTVVLGSHTAAQFEWVQRAFPLIQMGQLEFHRLLWQLSPRAVTPKWVRAVEIDDKAHARLGEPTNRAYLAKLISNAVVGNAAAIVLDIKLLSPPDMRAGEDEAIRTAENEVFIEAVRHAAGAGLPVILASWLEPAETGGFVTRPNVYDGRDLPLPTRDGGCIGRTVAPAHESRRTYPPTCVRIGNINLPLDKRQIPLVTDTQDLFGRSESLALATVQAFEDSFDRVPRTTSKPVIGSAIAGRDFVFGSFIEESDFQKLPIEALAGGTDEALRQARGRILIVGGTWREDLGHGDPVDTFSTPVGRMRGMYLHANYVEALLDDRYSRQVPLWMALLFDFLVGLWLYIRFHAARTSAARLRLLVIPGFLLLASYVVFANLNLYLDFILPLGACFVHLAVEYVRDKAPGDVPPQHVAASREAAG